MKLLAKTAEERYQTAAGVGARSSALPCANGRLERRIDDFPLGEHDTPDRLLIPEKLYGRAREIETLLAAFDRIVSERHAGAGAGLRLLRHRQVLRRQRAAQGAGSAARPVCLGQVRPVQARHPVCHAGAGLSEPDPSAPGQERSGAGALARCAP